MDSYPTVLLFQAKSFQDNIKHNDISTGNIKCNNDFLRPMDHIFTQYLYKYTQLNVLPWLFICHSLYIYLTVNTE